MNLKEIKLKWKNKERFTEKGSWPDQLDGSYLTYGWVLIFSALGRSTQPGEPFFRHPSCGTSCCGKRIRRMSFKRSESSRQLLSPVCLDAVCADGRGVPTLRGCCAVPGLHDQLRGSSDSSPGAWTPCTSFPKL